MVARRPVFERIGLGLPVTWQAQVWNEPDLLRLRFRHVAGATKGMDVTWRIEPTATGSRVSIEHVFRPRLMLFAMAVERWFTRPIAGRTLATFKALAETLAEAPPSPVAERSGGAIESETPAPTNHAA
jgi:hypothetical protein